MDTNQEAFVHDSPGNVQSFLDAVNTIKPTAIIGKKLLCVCAQLESCSLPKTATKKSSDFNGIDFWISFKQKDCIYY